MLKEINHLQFGEFTLDRHARELRKQGEVQPVSGKAFDLLSYMAVNAGRPLTRSELLDAVWPETTVEESNLTQHVFVLRKVLGGDGPIKTLAGRGYQFAAQVTELETRAATATFTSPGVSSVSLETTHTRMVIEDEVEETIVSNERPRRATFLSGRTLWVLAGTLAAGFILVAGWVARQHWLDHTGGSPVEVVITAMDGTTGDAVLDRALVDALRIDISQSPFVSVLSPALVRATLIDMKHKPDEPLMPDAAREVCERTNSQAVLHGKIARLGQHYLLTQQAASCVNGAVLAEAKQEALSAEDLPNSIDRLAKSLRRKLGESRRSIARFDVPLFPGNTASLEALKDYNQAELQADQGRFVDAIELMKKAVAADPSFAEAYYDLASYFRDTLDIAGERTAIRKAYSLRNAASEPARLAIIALYHSAVTQDLYEAERNYQEWTELYPRSRQAWSGLASSERELGRHADSLIAAERALALRPTIVRVYLSLSFEQRQAGDYRGSLATCERAIARGLDGDLVRDYLLQTAYALHDTARVQKLRDWAAAHPDAVFFRVEEAEIAITEGRFHDAHRLIAQIVALMQHRGMGVADDFVRAEAINLMEAGDAIEGSRFFRSVPVDQANDRSVLGLARVGDFTSATAYLHAMQVAFPQGTLWNEYRAPEVRAIIALATHKPNDALTALEQAGTLEGIDPVLTMMMADAYLAAGKPALAEKSYRRVAQGPYQNPDCIEVPLSWLGLGRALAAEGKRDAAIDAYEHFLAVWAHADPDALYFRQATREVADLKTAPSAQ